MNVSQCFKPITSGSWPPMWDRVSHISSSILLNSEILSCKRHKVFFEISSMKWLDPSWEVTTAAEVRCGVTLALKCYVKFISTTKASDGWPVLSRRANAVPLPSRELLRLRRRLLQTFRSIVWLSSSTLELHLTYKVYVAHLGVNIYLPLFLNHMSNLFKREKKYLKKRPTLSFLNVSNF